MNTFNRQNLKQLRQEIDQAVQALGKKHGIEFTTDGATYADKYATFKLKVNTLGNSEEAIQFDRFKLLHGLHHLSPGDTIQHRNTRYKILGMKPRSKKYPFLVENLGNGKTYKVPTDMLAEATKI